MASEELIQPNALRAIRGITNTPFFRHPERKQPHLDKRPPLTLEDCELAERLKPPRAILCHIPEWMLELERAYSNALKYYIGPDDYPSSLLKIREQLKPYGYQTYTIEAYRSNFYRLKNNVEPGSMIAGIFKNLEQFDFIELRSQGGHADVGVAPETVEKWNEQYGITIIGAGHKWFQFCLNSKPSDPEAFYAELVDLTDLVTAYTRNLSDAIENGKMISMGW